MLNVCAYALIAVIKQKFSTKATTTSFTSIEKVFVNHTKCSQENAREEIAYTILFNTFSFQFNTFCNFKIYSI